MTTTTRPSPVETATTPFPHDLRLTTDRPSAGTAVVRAAGDIDHATAPRLRELISSRLDGTLTHLVIDLSAVTFFGSAGLAVVEHSWLLATGRGIESTVRVGGSTAVRRAIGLLTPKFAAVVAD